MYHKRIKNAEQNTTTTAKNKIEIISSDFSGKFAGMAGDIKQIKDQQYKEFVDSIPGIVSGAINRFLGKM